MNIVIFWISVFAVIYTYFGYPIVLKFFTSLRNNKRKLAVPDMKSV